MPHNNELTIKETKFVRELIETGSPTEALMRSYNVKSRKNANRMAYQVKIRPRVQQAIRKALEIKGLTPDKVAEVLATNMLEGAGVKATAKDSNQAIRIWGELTGAFEPQEQVLDDKKSLTKLDTRDLVVEIRRRRDFVDTLLSEDAIVVTPDK